MRIIMYSDLHIKESSTYIGFNSIDGNGLSKELNNFIRGIEFVKDSIMKLKPDIVFNLGDTVNIVDRLSIRELMVLSKIKEIQDACDFLSIPHIILQGNHDIFSFSGLSSEDRIINSSEISIGCILSNMCTQYVSQITDYTYNDVKFSLIPYLPVSKELIQAYQDNGADIIMTHNEFKGSVYENGINSDSSLSVTKKVPVFSGHIHKPQVTGNIRYVGSLISIRFDRNIGPHGIGLYDTETKEYLQIENTYSRQYVKCKNLEELMQLDPDRYLIKLQTKESKDKVDEVLRDTNYIYVYMKEMERKKAVEMRYSIEKSQEPKEMLRAYLEENCDESVVELYDSVMLGEDAEA